LMADHYAAKHPEWARELQQDAVTMRQGLEEFKTETGHGAVAYLYANKRYFIPWGWWANAIPSLASSAWVILVDTDFNPFVLGGGTRFMSKSGVKVAPLPFRFGNVWKSPDPAHMTRGAYQYQIEEIP